MQAVIWWALIVLGVLLVSIVLSILLPRILALLGEIVAEINKGRTKIWSWIGEFVPPRLSAFWRARASEPREPVTAELRRVSDAVENLGVGQIETLVRLEDQLTTQMALLRSAAAPGQYQDQSEQQRIARTVASGSLAAIIFGVLIAVVFGAVNSFLLSVFFTETLPAYRLLSYPLPDIEAGQVLAVLFFVLEIAIGWSIYRGSHRQTSSVQGSQGGATQLIFDSFPWAMLVALMVVETFAYAVLSVRIDLPRYFGLDAGSAFFGIAKYFLALFGFCITGLLAYLGHAISESIDLYRRARVERSIVRALEEGKKSAVGYLDHVRRSVERIQAVVATMPVSIVDDFRQAIGFPDNRQTVPAAVRSAIVGAATSADPSAAGALLSEGTVLPSRLPVRTRTQVLSDLLISTLLFAGLAILSVLTVLEIAGWVRTQGLPLPWFTAWIAGVGITATVIMLGLGARSALRTLRYAGTSSHYIPEPSGRRVFGWVLVALFVVAALVLTVFGVYVRVLGLTGSGSAILGLFQTAGLIILAGFLDSGLVAIAHLLYLLWLGVVELLAGGLILLAAIVVGLLLAIAFILRLLAIPGDIVRSRRNPPTGTRS